MRPASIAAAPRGEGEGLFAFLRRELRPKGRLLTPFNVITVALIAATAVILYFRFTRGLGVVTNLDDRFPWGLWIGFDVMVGVAFAGGSYVLCFMVYVLRLEQYRPILRVTVLNGFLAYVFYAGALVLDLGRPWNVVNPLIGNSFGITSVLFLVAWQDLLYLAAGAVELSPAFAEWVGWKRLHRVMSAMTVGAVMLGITIAILHQSALGALFLMAGSKVHPLWYSEFLPVLFFSSSIVAGVAMVVFEGSISYRVFHDRVSPELQRSHDALVLSLARVAGGALFVYLALTGFDFIHNAKWAHLVGGWGSWYVLEIVGFGVIPMAMLLVAHRQGNLRLVKIGSLFALGGVLINRLNVSVIGFKWYEAAHYAPSWMEFVVTAGVISAELWVFRWVVMRMPVLGVSPSWAVEAHTGWQPAIQPVVERKEEKRRFPAPDLAWALVSREEKSNGLPGNEGNRVPAGDRVSAAVDPVLAATLPPPAAGGPPGAEAGAGVGDATVVHRA